jgi:pilus assembly protein CpaB
VALPPRPLVRPWRTLRRRPAPFWLAAVALSVVTGATVARLVGDAAAAADRYGGLRPALVATTDLEAGAVLGPGDAEVRDLPAAFLPAGALAQPVDGAVLAAAVLAGEPIVEARLAPAGTSAVAARLPPGARGVAVPTGPGALPLAVGDVVDVLATMAAEPTFPVAVGATVVDVGPDAATIAVEPGEASRVAYALTAGAVTLVLSGGP